MKRILIPFTFFAALAVAGCDREAHLPTHDEALDAMTHAHHDDVPVGTAAAAVEPAGPISVREVTYATIGGRKVIGYLATPAGESEGTPGIVVIHEWWGLNDNIRSMARQLAGDGYAALAVDLFGETAATPEDARGLVQKVGADRAAAETNLRAAVGFLRDSLDTGRMGVIGWCFGGTWSLNTALLAPDAIDAAVIYYGRMETDPQRLERLDAPVLGIFGAADAGIPLDHVHAVEARLDSLGKTVDFHVFEGADHAFANPSGTRYKEDAAAEAWELTAAFFARHLRN